VPCNTARGLKGLSGNPRVYRFYQVPMIALDWWTSKTHAIFSLLTRSVGPVRTANAFALSCALNLERVSSYTL